MAEAQTITWTKKRIQIAALAAQGKTFMEIIKQGYSNDMTSKVLHALKAGQKPPTPGLGEEIEVIDVVEQLEEEKGGGQVQDGEGLKEEGKIEELKEEEQLKEGEELKDTKKQDETPPSSPGKPLVAVGIPKAAPIIFRFEQKQILLDPIELHRQYSYFTDLASKDGGITNSFSQVLTLAMQTLWALHQNIPLTENMLRAIFYGGK